MDGADKDGKQEVTERDFAYFIFGMIFGGLATIVIITIEILLRIGI